MWNTYRLAEEGIENVQQLATCDVIELAIRTHYPLKTLLDWVDQAILIHNFAFAEHVRKLREQVLVTSAIDLAWMSPENSGGSTDLAQQLAKILELDPILVATKLNSLYQDEYVQFIWYLWQTRSERPPGGGRDDDDTEIAPPEVTPAVAAN